MISITRPVGASASLRKPCDFHIHYGAIQLGQPRPAADRRRRARSVPSFSRNAGVNSAPGRNDYFMKDSRVVRQHDVSMRPVTEQSDHRGMLAFDDLHHAPFGAAVGAPPYDPRQHMIAVHRISQAVASNEKSPSTRGIGESGTRKASRRDAPRFARPLDSDLARAWTHRLLRPREPQPRSAFPVPRWRLPPKRLRASLRRRALTVRFERTWSGKPELPSMDFFHFTALLQFLQHSRQIAASAMPQFHAMSNLADAGRLGKRGEMREHLIWSYFRQHGFFARLVGMSFAWCHTVSHRLTDLGARSKTCFAPNPRCLNPQHEAAQRMARAAALRREWASPGWRFCRPVRARGLERILRALRASTNSRSPVSCASP